MIQLKHLILEAKRPKWPSTSQYANIVQRKFGDISYKKAQKQQDQIERVVSNAIGRAVKLKPWDSSRISSRDAYEAIPGSGLSFEAVNGDIYYHEWSMPNGKRLWVFSMNKNGYSLHDNPWEKTVETDEYDSKWWYIKRLDKAAGKTQYGVSKQDSSNINLSRDDKALNPDWSSGMWAWLSPGSKAYEAVKSKVFGD